jgi:two-component system, OmpR family, sensor histidine kinase KdpD
MRLKRFRLKSKLRRLYPYFASTALIALSVFIAWHLPDETALSSVGIILLMSVLASAAMWGLRPGLVASVCAALAHDYYFVPPIYSFNIDDWENGFSWFIFSLSSLAVCLLADRLRQRTRLARHEELLAKRISAMSRRLYEAKDGSAIARITVSALGAALGARTILFIPKGHTFGIAAHPKGTRLNRAELEAAIRQYKDDGKKDDSIEDDELTCKLLRTKAAAEKAAVIVIGPTTRRRRGFQDRTRTIDLFAEQAAAAFERVALSQEIEDARIAAETEKLRSALLTSISHDLKAPLSIILGSASALQALSSSISQRSARDLLDSIQEEGERLDQFIANLLDMSRLEAEAVRPKRVSTDLDDLVGSALERAARILVRHRVVVEVPHDLPLLELDPAITERVLFNVLDNAAKYTPEGSQVTLAATQNGDFVDLRIFDEGDGIPEKELSHLFEKFYRVDTGDRKPQGTGLGLAICRGFLHAMGGSISACNRRDRNGAVFTLRFPIYSKPATASSALPEDWRGFEAL